MDYYRAAAQKPVYLCGNILDPRSKLSEISDQTLDLAQIRDRAELKALFLKEAMKFQSNDQGNSEVTSTNPEPERRAFGTRRFVNRGSKLTVEEEVDTYLSGLCEREDREPLDYWKLEQKNLPTLARMAQAHLAVPATSVSSERVFSGGSRLWTKYRMSMKAFTCEALLCVKSWFKFGLGRR